MARLGDIVIDCADPGALARFWAAVLDDYDVAPYDDDELERLRSIGIDDPRDDPTVLVESTGSALRLWFQKVPEGNIPESRAGKPPGQRIHLDLHHSVDDDGRETEVERHVGLGAVRLWDGEQGPSRWVTMADPEGNVFCVASS